jgi:hypothetical protein
MKPFRILLSLLAAAMLLPLVGYGKTEILKELPKSGTIPYGKVVYVDDGTCPQGQVKEVTGGSQQKSIPRKIRCVARPE